MGKVFCATGSRSIAFSLQWHVCVNVALCYLFGRDSLSYYLLHVAAPLRSGVAASMLFGVSAECVVFFFFASLLSVRSGAAAPILVCVTAACAFVLLFYSFLQPAACNSHWGGCFTFALCWGIVLCFVATWCLRIAVGQLRQDCSHEPLMIFVLFSVVSFVLFYIFFLILFNKNLKFILFPHLPRIGL